MSTPYWQKLRDPRWQKRRLEILNRSGFKCEDCKDESKTLTVHHSYYEKGKEPWEYPDCALHCLCEECHADRAQAERDLTVEVSTFNAWQVWVLQSNIRLAKKYACAPENIADAVGELAHQKWLAGQPEVSRV